MRDQFSAKSQPFVKDLADARRRMYEVPDDGLEMTEAEQDAWVAAVLKKIAEDGGGVPGRIA